jgi:signal transduction histidine kinase
MEFKRHVLMMFKEILNNIVKHAEATSVEITLELDRERLRIRVRDNGRGFDPAVDTDGRGMKTLESRASTIGGLLTIESKQGSGTVVCVEARIARL